MGEMSKELVDDKSPLLPLRHSTADLFVCDIFDAAPKADMASMEHPIFSLSTKPDSRRRRYEHGSHFVEVIPSAAGLATVHDRDILIYCISQLIGAMNQGRQVSKTVRMRAHDFLVATNRMTNGEGYDGLKAALERLRGTTISTNLITGGQEVLDVFGIIDKARIMRQTREGRMQDIEITLSDWVFNAIQGKEVLTLSRNYFRLRKPLERRMYELARKHCGQQGHWSISLDLLQKKCGSNSTGKEFRRLIRAIVKQDEAHQHLPDYAVTMTDMDVTFTNRRTGKKAPSRTADMFSPNPQLKDGTLDKARNAAPGYDIHNLRHEWIGWWRDSGSPDLRSPDAAFLSFCKKRHERAPMR